MHRHVVVVAVLYLRFLCANSFEHGELFEISDEVLKSTNCKRLMNDSQRFSLKTVNTIYNLPDICDGTDFSKFNYFPKCCPPGYNYESIRHNCVVNESNSTNVYDTFYENLLVRSHLDCPVIVDHIIDERSIIFHKSRAITFNKTLYDIGTYCIDWDLSKNSSTLRTCENIEVCNTNKCITKCCKDGFLYVGSKCTLNPEYGISVQNNARFDDHTDDFTGVIQAKQCTRFKDKALYNFTIKPDGKLVIKHGDQWMEFIPEDRKYCLEYYSRENRYVVFLCAFPNTYFVNYKVYIMRTLNIISCVSIVLTILGYVFLRELKNFLGKIIICYCGCLLLGTSSLTYGQFKPTEQYICTPLGFLVIFFYLAAFAWMNVLSFEIWQVLGSMSTQYGTQLYNERKKFFYYNLYAWSVPVLVLAFAVFSYHSEMIPEHMKPLVGKRFCFIDTNPYENNYSVYIFWAAPSFMYFLANAVLFTKTIRYISKVKNDIKDVTKNNSIEKQKRFRIDKERAMMVMRIFVIMGLSWLFEFLVILTQIDFSKHIFLKIIELFFDMFNSLQGFFIFCVFMAKKKIFIAVKQKFNHRKSIQGNSTSEVIMSCTSK